MNRIIKLKISFCSDECFNEELDWAISQLVFAKLSLLEDAYLNFKASDKLSLIDRKNLDEIRRHYDNSILRYLKFLRENVVLFKTKYIDWTDTWIKEIKPYIFDNFPDERLLHQAKVKGVNLYDRLHDIAKYSDLHYE